MLRIIVQKGDIALVKIVPNDTGPLAPQLIDVELRALGFREVRLETVPSISLLRDSFAKFQTIVEGRLDERI